MDSVGINTTINADCRECCPRESNCHLCCFHAEASEEDEKIQEVAEKADIVKPTKCVIL